MTREEAISKIKILKEDYWEDDGYGHETDDCQNTILALDMAINALEQEPCEDAISRQAALDALCEMLHDCFGADDEELDAVITTINELPPVTPAGKVGQWIGDAIQGEIDGQIVQHAVLYLYFE